MTQQDLWIKGRFRGCNAAAVPPLSFSLPLTRMSLSTHRRLDLGSLLNEEDHTPLV